MAQLEQQCPLLFVRLSWLFYGGVLIYLLVAGDLAWVFVWLVAAPLFQWLYIKTFPSTARFLGYGSVEDRAVAAGDLTPTPGKTVTVYSASLCPFCPIVIDRLESLQATMGFELDVVDVTARPDVVKRKGIRALPVVEVGDRQRVGNGTTEELADFVRKRMTGSARRSRPYAV